MPMKEIWNKYIKTILLLYCGLYTLATIINSVIYLVKGISEDPSGNWHELDRAVIVLVVVVAYSLIRFLKIKSFFLKVVIVYVSTMLLIFLYVYLRGLTVELAKSAYRDIFINYTAGFVLITIIVLIVKLTKKKKASKRNNE